MPAEPLRGMTRATSIVFRSRSEPGPVVAFTRRVSIRPAAVRTAARPARRLPSCTWPVTVSLHPCSICEKVADWQRFLQRQLTDSGQRSGELTGGVLAELVDQRGLQQRLPFCQLADLGLTASGQVDQYPSPIRRVNAAQDESGIDEPVHEARQRRWRNGQGRRYVGHGESIATSQGAQRPPSLDAVHVGVEQTFG